MTATDPPPAGAAPKPRAIPSPSDATGSSIVGLARERLQDHPHFRGHEKDVTVDDDCGRLVLTGRLPSFYLKQMLQSILRDLPGVANIDNRVDVVRWDGLSSEPRHPTRTHSTTTVGVD
ncbi:MAG: BON domain-containing protein [Planctomycetota bacterium]